MIVREQPSIFKVLFSWRGTILPKILPSLGVMYSTPPMIAEISITTPRDGKILGKIVPRQENKTLS
jgi:predicted membrane chloride channel (bestrophin family)